MVVRRRKPMGLDMPTVHGAGLQHDNTLLQHGRSLFYLTFLGSPNFIGPVFFLELTPKPSFLSKSKDFT